ncbi:sulfite exporter TauE/SafE family protein [Ornithobacterium rhinotracheale]|uniref:sulfite exporter TauE/SafE family protein n=1 Tax=Ornithobacterium rhinotracheale TaxID=28251 RepID=UPI00129C34BD|nr:sulfite exporter TauE/SafE family protein [Ornithobacterium rhinotracheale]MRI62977.1 sulfite exporter TauE/SafE family protein [Ornithobacterium rhinotracheale]
MDQTLLLLLIGLLAGLIGGLVGIGGGLIIVPFLVFLMGMSQHEAQGTSLATLLLPLSFLSVYSYNKAGYINWKYVLILSVTFMIGSYFGGAWALKIDQKTLKKIFGFIMILGAAKMFWDSYK